MGQEEPGAEKCQEEPGAARRNVDEHRAEGSTPDCEKVLMVFVPVGWFFLPVATPVLDFLTKRFLLVVSFFLPVAFR